MRWRVATASRVIFLGRRKGLVVKLRPSRLGLAECRGYAQIAPHFPVPRLFGFAKFRRRSISVFSKVPAVTRDAGLLADALQLDRTSEVESLVDAHAQRIIDAIRSTGTWAEPTGTVTALYQDRARSRLHEWWPPSGYVPSIGKSLQGWTWRIGDMQFSVTLTEVFQKLVEWADSPDPLFTILSQGDPTEMNLAVPLVYLDFKYAGRNSLVGEVANFCWAVMGQGSYYAPTYNRTSFHPHSHILHAAPANCPIVDYRLDEGRQIIDVHCNHRISPTRRAAALRFLGRVWPHVVAQHAGNGVDPAALSTRFLLARILLTFDPRTMSAPDFVFVASSAVRACSMGGVRYLEALASGEIQ
jgi:hypothetical protein